MKLSWRGGRSKGKGSVLMAGATTTLMRDSLGRGSGCMRASIVFVLTLAAGCSHRVNISEKLYPGDSLFFFVTDSTPGGTFPQITDSARVGPGGSIRAAPDSPPCSLDLKANTAGWDEVQTPIASRYFKAITLRLPPGFTSAWYSHPRDADEDDPEQRADSSGYWGHMLGSWDRFEGKVPHLRFLSGFTIWIGPEEGYPTSYIGGDKVRQVAFSECRVKTELGVLPVALFAVESPAGTLGDFHVVTYAQIQPGVYIQAIGHAPDSLTQALLLSTVSTLRIVR